MRLTNELREYVQRRVAEIVPEPLSKADADAVKEECKAVSKRYREYMAEKAAEFIEKELRNPLLTGCDLKPGTGYGEPHYISIAYSNSPVVQGFEEDLKAHRDFTQRINEKVFALLSVQKEVSDLDTFIANVIETVSK